MEDIVTLATNVSTLTIEMKQMLDEQIYTCTTITSPEVNNEITYPITSLFSLSLMMFLPVAWSDEDQYHA
jgi:hypothetical protein